MKQNKLRGWIYVAIQFIILICTVFSARLENSLLNHEYSNTIYFISLTLIFISVITGLLSLINFKQYMTPNPVPSHTALLRTGGIYSLIRHPMYFTVLIFMIGITLFSFAYWTEILNLVLVFFFISKINFEEKMLEEKYPEYKSYQLKTKKLIPFIY